MASRLHDDGVCDAIAEALLILRCPDKCRSEQIRSDERNQIDDAQNRPHSSLTISDRRMVLFFYDLDLHEHLTNCLSVSSLEQREIKECNDDVDQDERAKERAD